jgi:cytochrome c oxidase subunit II
VRVRSRYAHGELRAARRRARRCAVLAAFLTAACDGAPSALDPRGPGAARIAGLWWLMLVISIVVFVVVLVLMAMGLRRAGSAAADPRRAVRWGEPLIVLGGVVIPAVVLTAVFVVSLRDMSALSSPQGSGALEISVTGHDWWWEVAYDRPGAVTANEIHIPVGEPVQLELTTDDVIHSFWVPQLQAKTDMVPGRVNRMWIEADEPGRYRGQCAEFCGLQHANMIFYVIAQPRADFETWLEGEARPAVEPGQSSAIQGRDVFLRSTCAGCHAVRGTSARARVGPDLTHLATRETIASGVLDNSRINLARFITDPQEVKPGAIMPPTELSSQELSALLDYLEGLR